MTKIVLDGLLITSMILSIILIIVSTAALGRKLADLEYQGLVGLNGVRTIQSWINVRMQINRVMLGVAFIVFSTLLLADAPAELRTWSFRVMFVVMLAGFAGSSIVDWLSERQQLQILMRDQPTRSVDVATIQPAAVADIASAINHEPVADVPKEAPP